MTTKYLHQATLDGPIVEFSDRPFKAGGVKIRPKWAISAEFRKHLQRVYRVPGPNPSAAAQYVRWYAEKHGLAYGEARKALELV